MYRQPELFDSIRLAMRRVITPRAAASLSVVLTVLIVLAGSVTAQRAGRNPSPRLDRQTARLVSEAEAVARDRFSYESRTPNGVRVFSVTPPRREMMLAIDKGFGDLFAIARRHNYRRRLNFQDYTVFIARADRTTSRAGDYSPDIKIAVAQYAGTVYDAGGFMFAAGMVLDLQQCAFIIADHARDFARVSSTVRYEGEHLVLYHNDSRRFQATADHSQGGGHPILK